MVLLMLVYTGPLGPDVATSPTATSVNVTWTQPEFSQPVQNYTVSLIRRARGLCPSVQDSRPRVTIMPTVTSIELTNLQEFSVYTVSVAALFDTFGLGLLTPNKEYFTTLSAGD